MPCGYLGLEARRPDLRTPGPLFFRLIKRPRSGLCACDQAHWSADPGQKGAFAACCPLPGVLVPDQGSLLPPRVLGCVLVLTCRGSSLDLAQLDLPSCGWAGPFSLQDLSFCPPAPQPGRPATCRFPAGLLHPLMRSTSSPDRGRAGPGLGVLVTRVDEISVPWLITARQWATAMSTVASTIPEGPPSSGVLGMKAGAGKDGDNDKSHCDQWAKPQSMSSVPITVQMPQDPASLSASHGPISGEGQFTDSHLTKMETEAREGEGAAWGPAAGRCWNQDWAQSLVGSDSWPGEWITEQTAGLTEGQVPCAPAGVPWPPPHARRALFAPPPQGGDLASCSLAPGIQRHHRSQVSWSSPAASPLPSLSGTQALILLFPAPSPSRYFLGSQQRVSLIRHPHSHPPHLQLTPPQILLSQSLTLGDWLSPSEPRFSSLVLHLQGAPEGVQVWEDPPVQGVLETQAQLQAPLMHRGPAPFLRSPDLSGPLPPLRGVVWESLIPVCVC